MCQISLVLREESFGGLCGTETTTSRRNPCRLSFPPRGALKVQLSTLDVRGANGERENDDDNGDNDTEELRVKKAVRVEGSRAEWYSRLMFGGVSSKCLIGSASVRPPSPLIEAHGCQGRGVNGPQ